MTTACSDNDFGNLDEEGIFISFDPGASAMQQSRQRLRCGVILADDLSLLRMTRIGYCGCEETVDAARASAGRL